MRLKYQLQIVRTKKYANETVELRFAGVMQTFSPLCHWSEFSLADFDLAAHQVLLVCLANHNLYPAYTLRN